VTNFLWHYTIPSKFKEIFHSKKLIPSPYHSLEALFSSTASNEKSILWFSSNQDWENSVCWGVHGRDEMLKQFGSLFRVGLQPNQKLLVPWIRLQKTANLCPTTVSQLETDAQKVDANPGEWWGTTSSVPESEWRSVQKFVEGKWKDTQVEDEIRLRAYWLYVQQGRKEGFALDDWLQAEAEILGIDRQ
jgi:hypothetical protein